ncbi:ubiquinol-cytochrome c reductase [Bacteroidota bacterium]|nr:ubiquinol-cytochrome c reductase [Bacteroidota bacterium]
MNYWIVKSDPETFGWSELVKEKKTDWTGVRNYAARIHLKAMKKGDKVLFYHSNQGLAIVGIAKVTKEFFQDSTAKDEAWVAVELTAIKELKNAVSLSEMKTKKELSNIGLIKIGRLSVMPITKAVYDIIIKMGKK